MKQSEIDAGASRRLLAYGERMMVLPEQSLRLTVSGGRERAFSVRQAVIAGWTGRDPAALEKHIRELEDLGVTRPSSVPIFYRVSTNRVVTSAVIEVSGDRSSGEAEFVLVQSGGRLYVGAGSDHTDRVVETYGVAVSKQMCDKPVAPELWDFSDVSGHWDTLLLRSWIWEGDRRVLYQEGPVTTMRAPADLIERCTGNTELPEGTVMFCGTLAARGGVRPSPRFEFELEDPVRGHRIRHGYDVVSLPIAG